MDLSTLEATMERGKLLTNVKFLNQFDTIDTEKFPCIGKNQSPRGENMEMSKKRVKKDVRKYFNNHRVVEE